MTFHTDGPVFKDLFGTPEMREAFREERFVERFLEVEAALARVQGDLGMIPEDAAAEIDAHASLDHVDLDLVSANVEEIHLFTMAIIEAWKEGVGDAGEYIHWGATSQDVSDTALLLQVREGLEIVRDDLERIGDVLAALAEEHAETPMIGRTHHVHAIPITFGLKAATWLDELGRHLDRIDELAERLFVVEFFGATGTLASVGEEGLAVQEGLAEELDLRVPDVAWYAARDRFTELLTTLGMVASTLGRISKGVLMLNRPDIGELAEPIGEDDIGSSTMPHKRNPVKSEEAHMLARLVRSDAGLSFELMEGHDERDASTWFAEFAVVPRAFLYTSRALANVEATLGGLGVDEERMQENLGHFGGVIASERVMMALAERVGRQTAHDVVGEAAMAAFDGEDSFADLLLADDRIDLPAERIAALTDPETYTGVSAELTRRAVESWQAR